ncbi:uncharacterized protein V1510DRAFT_377461 [Dipodascopsis tothii]|uniref:uncharacterized protein n=1 Tax=Dipodascopsis tothii TaxID=44089 RepID=UPI0034CFCCF8
MASVAPATPQALSPLGSSLSSNATPSAGSNKHTCPHCSQTFTRHHNLKSHLLTHSQEKPYTCTTCNSKFRRLHDLKRHSKLHTGEKPYICSKCGRKFARGDALARHLKGANGCAGKADGEGSDDESPGGKSPRPRPFSFPDASRLLTPLGVPGSAPGLPAAPQAASPAAGLTGPTANAFLAAQTAPGQPRAFIAPHHGLEESLWTYVRGLEEKIRELEEHVQRSDTRLSFFERELVNLKR